MLVSPLVVVAAVLLAIVLVKRGLRRPRRPGAGAAGAVYELLNEDRRRALEIIVEEKAEATDPESADGNLPDLEGPNGRARH
jgi:hypothetical protein